MADMRLHEMVTDVTTLTGMNEVEKQNTISLTKTTEIRSSTFMAIIFGGLVGGVIALTTYWLLSYASFLFVIAGAVLVPWLKVGTTKDGRDITRWKRFRDNAKSRNMHGRLFFVNSQYPIDLNSIRLTVIEEQPPENGLEE